MSNTPKKIGLCVIVVVASTAFSAMGASAATGGHFVSEVSHTLVDQTISGTSGHQLHIKIDSGPEGTAIACKEARAVGTAAAGTVTEAIGETSLSSCYTTDNPDTLYEILENGCQGKATVASGNPSSTEQTGHLICPAGKSIEITHPNCTATVPPQTVTGLTYTSTTVNGKHAITVDVNVEYILYYHSGICIFLGTNHTATVNGSTVIRGYNTEGNLVDITAT